MIALTGDADVEDVAEPCEVDGAFVEQCEDEASEKAQGARVEGELRFERGGKFEYSVHGGVVVDPPLYISCCARRSTRLLSGTQLDDLELTSQQILCIKNFIEWVVDCSGLFMDQDFVVELLDWCNARIPTG